MPSFDQQTKSWRGRVRVSGSPQKVKTGFKTKLQAVEWEIKAKKELKSSLAEQKTTRLGFSLVSSQYLKYCQNHDYSPGTIQTKAQIIRDFLSFLGYDPPFEEINESLIESYLNSKSRKKTANRHLRELRTIYNWLIKKKYCKENPCNFMESYRVKQFVRYVPPPESINKVLSVADDFQFDFIQCVYHLSARRKEILELKWKDVDFENKTVAIWTRKRYGGTLEMDIMQMNNILHDVLKRRASIRIGNTPWVFSGEDGKQLGRTKVEKMIKKLCEKAEVEEFGFHAIRHHVSAIMAASKKLSLIEIQKQLRHKNATTTDHYLKSLINESAAASVLETLQSDSQKEQSIIHATELEKDENKKSGTIEWHSDRKAETLKSTKTLDSST